MFIGQDAQHETGLQRLAGSELAQAWLNEYANGWGQSELSHLVTAAEREGFGDLPADAVHRMMMQLRDATADDARRVSHRTGPSIGDIQTVSRLATGGWVDLDDFADRYGFNSGDLWLNRCPGSGTALGITDDRHMGMFCQTRGGKGVSFIIPQHCLWRGSLVSIDPSGENATITAARRGDGRDDDGNEMCVGMGQQTHVLDPMHAADVPKKYRKRFNPLEALDPAEPKFIEKAAALADAMVVRSEDESEPVWNNKARTLIKGLILHIKTAPHFNGRRNLVTLRELATLGDRELLKLSGEDGDAFEALFSGMRHNEACGNVIPAIGEEFFKLLTKGVDKQWSGFHSALTDQTEFLESPLLQDCLKESDFELRELKEHPDGCSLFLCLPEGDLDTYKGWVRMMIYLIDYEVRRERGNGVTGKPILMCVDEFAALGSMERIGNGLPNISKYGLQYLLILQNIPQIKAAYPKTWESIMDCLAVKLFAAVGDPETAKWVSDRCGETDLVLDAENQSLTLSEQRTEGKTQSESTSHGGSRTRTDTTGSSRSKTLGHSRSTTAGSSRTHTFGSSSSDMFGTNASYSRGGGSSQSETGGSSDNESYSDWKFGRSIPEQFRFMRENANRSVGRNRSSTSGTNSSWNESQGNNRSHTDSTNQSNSQTDNQSSTEGQSVSSTDTQQQSTAHSTGESWNQSQTTGSSQSRTDGKTQAVGTGQTFHKRPVITVDEVMLRFARGQQGDVYALGLGLLLVDSEQAMVVERTPYFVDPAFDGLWCLNPAYPDTRPLPLVRTWDVGFAIKNTGPLFEGGKAPRMGRWIKRPGERVERGEAICEVLPGPTVAGYDDSRLAVRAPVAGVLEAVERGEGEKFEGGVVLGSIRYHLGEQL